MIIFRPTRGSLNEALRNEREFCNMEELKKYVAGQYSININSVCVDGPEVNDHRIGWEDTRYVCIIPNTEKMCVGYCATKYPK